jgi:hypothetical protein
MEPANTALRIATDWHGVKEAKRMADKHTTLASPPPKSEIMQLRVARLCLDCEELHVDNTCPRCASSSHMFLSKWLPVEERRRWRRPITAGDENSRSAGSSLVGTFRRWWSGEPQAESVRPLTREADRVASMSFDGLELDRSVSRQEIDVRSREPGIRKA